MNWYKKAQQLKPWQMTREQYRSILVPELKPNETFYIEIAGRDVEVIQNPTGIEMRQMTGEFRSQFPNYERTPALRSTQDENGNKYYWKSNEAMHAYMEPKLSRMVGSKLNQNANKPLYERVVYDALEAGEQVSQEIFNEFAQKYPDVAKKYNRENYELV